MEKDEIIKIFDTIENLLIVEDYNKIKTVIKDVKKRVETSEDAATKYMNNLINELQ